MTELKDREILVMVRDGDAEYGVAVVLGAFGPKALLVERDATDHVRDAVVVLDRLIRSGVTFDALAAMAADSPRVGDVIDQLAQRIHARDFTEKKTEGESA